MEPATRKVVWKGLEELRPVLRSFLRGKCRDESEVDDVIQETLLRAARYRPGLADPTRLTAWTVRIASNVFRDQRRRDSRMVRLDPHGAYEARETHEDWTEKIESREACPGDGGEDVHLALGLRCIEKGIAVKQLGTALEELRGEDRQVLASYYSGAGSCRETAEECGIAPALVKIRLFRARRRLLRLLRRRLALFATWAPVEDPR